MTGSEPPAWQFSLSTAWEWSRQTPLRQFLRTETGGAAVLLAATIGALIWANVDQSSYEACWGTELSVHLGTAGLAADLQEWINSGLMAFFFLVAGLDGSHRGLLGGVRQHFILPVPALVICLRGK